jgi:hypothetical protein
MRLDAARLLAALVVPCFAIASSLATVAAESSPPAEPAAVAPTTAPPGATPTAAAPDAKPTAPPTVPPNVSEGCATLAKALLDGKPFKPAFKVDVDKLRDTTEPSLFAMLTCRAIEIGSNAPCAALTNAASRKDCEAQMALYPAGSKDKSGASLRTGLAQRMWKMCVDAKTAARDCEALKAAIADANAAKCPAADKSGTCRAVALADPKECKEKGDCERMAQTLSAIASGDTSALPEQDRAFAAAAMKQADACNPLIEQWQHRCGEVSAVLTAPPPAPAPGDGPPSAKEAAPAAAESAPAKKAPAKPADGKMPPPAPPS